MSAVRALRASPYVRSGRVSHFSGSSISAQCVLLVNQRPGRCPGNSCTDVPGMVGAGGLLQQCILTS